MATFEEAYLPRMDIDEEALLSFGFAKTEGAYLYETDILDGSFRLKVCIQGKDAWTKLIETESGEPYELYRIESAHGDYVGMIRDAVKEVLLRIRSECYPVSWTKRKQPAEILDFIHREFGEKEEYPWKDDDSAVVRRKDNRKWYALFMEIPVSKLGIQEDRLEVVMNIAHDGNDVDHKVLYPAYHMNKKFWVSMVLDGTVPTGEILDYIRQSRESVFKAKKRK